MKIIFYTSRFFYSQLKTDMDLNPFLSSSIALPLQTEIHLRVLVKYGADQNNNNCPNIAFSRGLVFRCPANDIFYEGYGTAQIHQTYFSLQRQTYLRHWKRIQIDPSFSLGIKKSRSFHYFGHCHTKSVQSHTEPAPRSGVREPP